MRNEAAAGVWNSLWSSLGLDADRSKVDQLVTIFLFHNHSPSFGVMAMTEEE